ncbi:MAG: hypothetical protein ACQETH_13765 [Candidatus Rifleibacteriota bacterium]
MKKLLLLCLAALVITGCGGSEPAKEKQTKVEDKKPVKPMTKTEKLKQKAKVSEAASIIGYDGKKIHKELDQIIDQSAEHKKMLEDAGDL